MSLTVDNRRPPVYASLVVPVFEERDNLAEFYSRASAALGLLGREYEIIFVDDASRDGSHALLRGIASASAAVRVLRLARRSGQQTAYVAGLAAARGRYVVTADADLQYSLREIPRMLEKLAAGCDAVAGRRAYRRDPAYRRFFSFLLNRLMDLRTGKHIDDWGCSFCAMDARLAEAVLALGRNARFLKAAAILKARRVEQVDVEHFKRPGASKYSFAGLCLLACGMLRCDLSPSGNWRELFTVVDGD